MTNKKKTKRTFSRKKQTTPQVVVSFSPQAAVSLKRNPYHFLLLVIPFMLFFIFLTLLVTNNFLLQQIVQNNPRVASPLITIHPYPQVANLPLVHLSAKAAMVMDVDSFVVVVSKEPQMRLPMASTTKLMTALVALEYFKKDSLLTVKQIFAEGSRLKLQPGQQFYFEDLLYAMLLPSANDAAMVIADNYPGGVPAFVAKMNEKAAMYHLTNTHFVDPTGLEAQDTTTVTDMARLAAIAIQNPTIKQVTGTKETIIADLAGNSYYLSNLNKLLGTNGVTGLKTGTTEEAGEVLVTSVTIDNHAYIIVVMNSKDRFADTTALINFIHQSVKFVMPSLP